MLYVTGDIHGDLDFQKIIDWVGATKLNKDKDYLIILGDFGYVWENKRDNYEKEKLDFIFSHQNTPTSQVGEVHITGQRG